MDVIPAIDLKGGRCVRLYQGDYDREQVFSDDPVAVALEWQRQGAQRLHIVDLEGARDGLPANLEAVEAIAAQATVPLQVGGGIRDLATAQHLLAAGAQRVVLGTAAVEEPTLVEAIIDGYDADAVIVSIDARDGLVALRGWRASSHVTARDLLASMVERGVRRFVYTDISRDGTMTAPNFAALEEVVAATQGAVLAAGGIASVEHLVRLAQTGVEGAIVGQALYVGAFSLTEALERVGRATAP